MATAAAAGAASQSSLSRALDWWLVRVRKHPILVHLAAGLAIALALDKLIVLLDMGDGGLWKDPGIELASLAFGFAIPLLVTILALSSQFTRLLAIVRATRPAATPVMLRILNEELREMEVKIDELQVLGRSYPSDAIPGWVGVRCFSVTRGRYLAADTCTPSQFMERYGRFLDEHAAYLGRRRRRDDSIRVNLASPEDLSADRRKSPDCYRAYQRWHVDNHVELVHLDPRAARTIAVRCGLGDRLIDAGLWVGELVLNAQPQRDRVRVTVGLAGGPLYRMTRAYIRELICEAGEFPPL